METNGSTNFTVNKKFSLEALITQVYNLNSKINYQYITAKKCLTNVSSEGVQLIFFTF